MWKKKRKRELTAGRPEGDTSSAYSSIGRKFCGSGEAGGHRADLLGVSIFPIDLSQYWTCYHYHFTLESWKLIMFMVLLWRLQSASGKTSFLIPPSRLSNQLIEIDWWTFNGRGLGFLPRHLLRMTWGGLSSPRLSFSNYKTRIIIFTSKGSCKEKTDVK